MPSKELCTGRVITALLMFLVFVVASVIALGFPEKARLMPLLISVLGAILGLVQLVVEIRASAKGVAGRTDTGADAELQSAERGMFAWILVFFVGILGFGFVYAAPALVFAFLLVGKRESLLVATICSVGIWGALYGGFEVGFELPLFKGLILEWLGD